MKLNKLAMNANEAMKAAMLAMTSAGELGKVLEFLRKNFSCHLITELAATRTIDLSGDEPLLFALRPPLCNVLTR